MTDKTRVRVFFLRSVIDATALTTVTGLVGLTVFTGPNKSRSEYPEINWILLVNQLCKTLLKVSDTSGLGSMSPLT